MSRASGRGRRARSSGVPAVRFLRSLSGLQAPRSPARTPASRGRTPGRWLRAAYPGPGGARSYDVYLPAGHRRTTRVPLLVLLHGCNQTAEQFAAATRFTALADRHGFLLVTPKQSRVHSPAGCWRWFDGSHQLRGAGEPAVLAGITATVLAERSRWRVDDSRVYVAGISAGAAMALTLGATYPEVFAAIGMHSGPAYRSASSASGALAAMAGRGDVVVPPPGAGIPPLIVFQGVADLVVDVRNGDQVTRQWLACDAARVDEDGRRPRTVTRSRTVARTATDGRRYTVTRWYTGNGRKRLEYWRIDGLGHAWSGGLRDGSYSDPRGPRASTAMWSFFATQSR
jgi:poly(hydroxyalkanoate) depolymerase family esterase